MAMMGKLMNSLKKKTNKVDESLTNVRKITNLLQK